MVLNWVLQKLRGRTTEAGREGAPGRGRGMGGDVEGELVRSVQGRAESAQLG